MHAQLASSIPAARLARYVTAASAESIDPLDLYRWSSKLSLALFDDISAVEVAMRSAMATELSKTFGIDWFRQTQHFDDDTTRLIAQAWTQGRLPQINSTPDVIHGKLVASLMFGFWVKLLGRGSYAGKAPFKVRKYYDDALWKPALSSAFPQAGSLQRANVEKTAHSVQLIRNRVAHHEHVIWGTPVFGQRNPDGTPRRLSVSVAHANILTLAGYLSVDLNSWLTANSLVPATLSSCPLANRSGLLL